MDNPVCVRPAEAVDAACIRAMNCVFNESDVSVESIADMLRTPSAEVVLVAEVEGKVIGFAAAQVQASICYGQAWAELTELYVEPTSRRIGAGRALVSGIEAAVRQKGAMSMFLRSARRNIGASAFYTACGLVEVPHLVFEKALPGEGDDHSG